MLRWVHEAVFTSKFEKECAPMPRVWSQQTTGAKKESDKVNEMAQYKNFGEFLQKKREAKQITLRKMADMLDITAPYLSDIEKDRRNPPDMDKLEQISSILLLNDEDKTLMFDLAGKKRNSVAPDLPEYIMGREYVAAALRTARDLDADEADWLKFVEELRNRKG